MSGLKSRRKGNRGEYLLRDALRTLGYVADRVPASGAAQGFKGDVRFSKAGVTRVAEIKLRKRAFTRLYDAALDHAGYAFMDGTEYVCVDMGYDLEKCLENDAYTQLDPAKDHKLLRKLKSVRGFVKDCDLLVLKDDQKPLLYLRYR